MQLQTPLLLTSISTFQCHAHVNMVYRKSPCGNNITLFLRQVFLPPFSHLIITPRVCGGRVKQLVLSSVCPVKIFEISRFTGLNDCLLPHLHSNPEKNLRIRVLYIPDSVQSGTILRILSSFLFNIGTFCHF